MTARIECPKCWGTGSFRRRYGSGIVDVFCGYCLGSGRVSQTEERAYYRGRRILCPSCVGSGEIQWQPPGAAPDTAVSETCPLCAGDLYVTRTQAEKYGLILQPISQQRRRVA